MFHKTMDVPVLSHADDEEEENIIHFTKAQRIRWIGRVRRMDNMKQIKDCLDESHVQTDLGEDEGKVGNMM